MPPVVIPVTTAAAVLATDEPFPVEIDVSVNAVRTEPVMALTICPAASYVIPLIAVAELVVVVPPVFVAVVAV